MLLSSAQRKMSVLTKTLKASILVCHHYFPAYSLQSSLWSSSIHMTLASASCFIMSWNAVYPYACPRRSLKALHTCCLSTIGRLHLMLLLLTQSTDPCPYRTYNPHFYTSLYIPLSRQEQRLCSRLSKSESNPHCLLSL